MSNQRGMHGIWAGRWTFMLAAAGSAVGLGNIWKFPYMAGENGGGAFVIMYLLCIVLVGIPVMVAEILVGRKGRMSPINSMRAAINENNSPFLFRIVGPMGAFAAFLILSFYSVVAGWAIHYIIEAASGGFTNITAQSSGAAFEGLLANPSRLLVMHSIFMVMVIAVVAGGVNKGLEMASRILMPLLFVLLIGLFFYSMTLSGFKESLSFLFDFDSSKITRESLVSALGHSFFTLSLGLGSIMVYGAYMPKENSIGKTAVSVAIVDTLVALVAGIVIFAVVFTNGMTPGAGPGLMFATLPVAFGSLPGGAIIATVFFVLVAVAAWTSAISLAEPSVSWVIERGMNRILATLLVCGLAWGVGIAALLSFNDWGGVKPLATIASWFSSSSFDELAKGSVLGLNIFDILDKLTTNILLPLGGLLVVLFVAWFTKSQFKSSEIDPQEGAIYKFWLFTSRFIAPVAVVLVFLHGLGFLDVLMKK